jgi:tripartite-type tricarboxylate transporter receptor subunit TctC
MARLGAIVLAFALTGTVGKADDQYPAKPVRIVVSFSAGGPTDTVARIIGAKMGDLLGQQFFVENKVGAAATSAPTWSPSPRRTVTRC